jgi:hypothetical protein
MPTMGLPVSLVLINKATDPAVAQQLPAIAIALYIQSQRDHGPVWGVFTSAVRIDVEANLKPGEWSLIIADNSDQAGALGYHDVNSQGMPQGWAFSETAKQGGMTLSQVISHEMLEMFDDAGINLAAYNSQNVFVAYETADPVQDQTYVIAVPHDPANPDSTATVPVVVSNFVYPSWFEGFHQPGSVPFDHLGSLQQPFQLSAGGYISVFTNGGWQQIFGSQQSQDSYQPRNRVPRRRRRFEAPPPAALAAQSVDTPFRNVLGIHVPVPGAAT